MSSFDFLKAKSAHLNWRLRILGLLNGEGTLTRDQVVSHKHCDLGKWLYSEGLDKYKEIPEMIDLEKVHKDLHTSISKVVELKEKHLIKEARDEYEKMRETSEILIQIIDVLVTKLKS